MDPKSLPGGPAFPISIPGCGDNGAHGMSLRDYFAAAALQGMLARPNSRPLGYAKDPDGYANAAYNMADEMLKAREGCHYAPRF